MMKERMINVRLSERTHEEFKIAAELRGASMSGLLHQFIVRTIREEKERESQAFRGAEIRRTATPKLISEPKIKKVS